MYLLFWGSGMVFTLYSVKRLCDGPQLLLVVLADVAVVKTTEEPFCASLAGGP